MYCNHLKTGILKKICVKMGHLGCALYKEFTCAAEGIAKSHLCYIQKIEWDCTIVKPFLNSWVVTKMFASC